MKNQLLVERFQKLAGITSLNETPDHDPWNGQTDMFSPTEQFDMTPAAKEAYDAWTDAINQKYGSEHVLYPSDQQYKGHVRFDLKNSSSAQSHFISIDGAGIVKLPINFYRNNHEEEPDWMQNANSSTLRPITTADIPQIIQGLEERP
jgi:hypothetical protein